MEAGHRRWQTAGPRGGVRSALHTRRALRVSPPGAVLLPWLMSQHWGQAGCDLGAPELLSGASDTQAAMEQPLLLLN